MIHTLSYSQIDLFRDCPRKWAWRTLDRVEGEENPAAAFGVRVHKQIEENLRNGIPLDLTTPEGEVAMSGYHLWPREVVGFLGVEEQFRVEIGGFPFKGIKDLRYVDPSNPEEPVVADHKTTSDFRYAKTEAELEVGLQSNIYAEHEFQTTPAESVRLRWLYYRTKGTRKAHEVSARVFRDSPVRLAVLEQIAADAATMTNLRARGFRALDLPPNPLACDKYGGCSYRSLCNLTDIERFRAAMANSSEILARLQGQIGANPPAPPGAPPAPPTQQPNPGMRFAFIQNPGQPGGWAEVPIGMPIPNEVQFGTPQPPPPQAPPVQYQAPQPQAPPVQYQAPPAPPQFAPAQAPALPPAQDAPAPKKARKSKDETSDACSAAIDTLVGRAAAPGVPASEALAFAQAAETISRIGK